MKPIVVAVLLSVPLLAQQPESKPQQDQAALEAAFAAKMTGCRMVGRFTDSADDGPAKSDSYTIAGARKLQGSKWRFDAKIEYGERSVTVPVIVDVKWAGDTPVIQVTDLTIPLLGRYTARVVVYGDEYAGLWSGAKHGGHMFGRIERAEEKPQSRPAGDADREKPPADDRKRPPTP